jgi:histidine ammonia-lyase
MSAAKMGPEQILELCYEVIATDMLEIHRIVRMDGADRITSDVTERVLGYVKALVPASKEERELAATIAEIKNARG